jgi:hypothetical protein
MRELRTLRPAFSHGDVLMEIASLIVGSVSLVLTVFAFGFALGATMTRHEK